ncbi:hypothetical protein MMC29_006508, partial [Sticta canariensis]|nr:hypothetical protein [Sticta canariensis]
MARENPDADAREPLLAIPAGETWPTIANPPPVTDDVNGTDEAHTPTAVEGGGNRPRQGFTSELQDMKSNAVLRAQGHEASMRRSFSPLAALGLGFRHVLDESITNSWVGYMSCFGQNLAYAGPQNAVFGLLVATVVQWTVTLGLSEVASCFPSSGGQYHFVFILAPKKGKKFAAFVIGWMNLLAWSICLCSGISVFVASVSGLASFLDTSYEPTPWQLYLMYLATAVVSVIPVFAGPRHIPIILQASLVLSVTGFFVVFLLALLLRKQTQPLSFITSSYRGTSGWEPATAWMMGVGNI